jgi:hypothetical protein
LLGKFYGSKRLRVPPLVFAGLTLEKMLSLERIDRSDVNFRRFFFWRLLRDLGSSNFAGIGSGSDSGSDSRLKVTGAPMPLMICRLLTSGRNFENLLPENLSLILEIISSDLIGEIGLPSRLGVFIGLT